MKKLTWIGRYGYSFEEENNFWVPFEINVTDNDGSFEGTAYEDEFSLATGDLVHVKGFIEGDFISFVKSYPYEWWVNDEGFICYNKDYKGHQVTYQGTLDWEAVVWSGHWEIINSEERVAGKPGAYTLDIVSGPWDMELKITD